MCKLANDISYNSTVTLPSYSLVLTEIKHILDLFYPFQAVIISHFRIRKNIFITLWIRIESNGLKHLIICRNSTIYGFSHKSELKATKKLAIENNPLKIASQNKRFSFALPVIYYWYLISSHIQKCCFCRLIIRCKYTKKLLQFYFS